jgi:hypothetical protein
MNNRTAYTQHFEQIAKARPDIEDMLDLSAVVNEVVSSVEFWWHNRRVKVEQMRTALEVRYTDALNR